MLWYVRRLNGGAVLPGDSDVLARTSSPTDSAHAYTSLNAAAEHALVPG